MKKALSVLLACLLVLMPLVVSCAETAGEKNALAAAKLYLSTMPLSYQGVLDQLEFDGYTSSEAQYGANNCGASWKEQAVRSAETYLGSMPLSEKQLREQLSFDGYTDEEVEYAIEKAYNSDNITSQAATQKTEQTVDELVATEPDNFFPITEIIKEAIPMSDFDKLMSDRGYTGAPSPVIGDITVYSNQCANPYQVLVAYNKANKKTTGSAIVYYSKETATLSYIIELLTKQFGTPAPTPDTQNTGESLNWNSNGTKYQLSVLGTLDNAKKGNEDFFLIIDNEENIMTSDVQDSEEQNAKTLLDLFPKIKKGMTVNEVLTAYGKDKFTEGHKYDDTVFYSIQKTFKDEQINIDLQFKGGKLYSIYGVMSPEKVNSIVPDYTDVYGKYTKTTIENALFAIILGKITADKSGNVYAWLTKDYLITISEKTGGIEYTFRN